MADRWDGIFFLLKAKQYAFRAWERVPSAGDWVVFAPEDKPFRVVRVIWRETRSPPHADYVEIEIEPVKGK